MSNVEIHYDELWKDAVENLFPYFINLIAPDFYPHVDWSKPIAFLDEELRQISPASEETKRFVDRLVSVWMLNGEERWVLVHVEVQGYRNAEFSRRMFIYFYRIYDKFKRDILSIAVFADPSAGYKPDRFNYQFFGCELSFRYRIYKILEQDDSKLKASDNPFALVVLAAKRSLQSRGDEEKRFRFKRELVSLMLEKGYSREEILHVFRFLDGVLALTDLSKERIIYNELRSKEVKEVAYLTNFERLAIEEGMKKGMKEGIKEGIKEGMKEGIKEGMREGMKKGEQIGMLRDARELVMDALEEKFGEVPEELQGRLQEIQSREVLRGLLRHTIRASCLEDFMKSLKIRGIKS